MGLRIEAEDRAGKVACRFLPRVGHAVPRITNSLRQRADKSTGGRLFPEGPAMRHTRSRKVDTGLTLVEVLIVIIILGILAALVKPQVAL